MKKRLSTPRAATVIVLAAVVAVSVTVAPSIAANFLTPQAASQKFVSKQKASKTYLSKAGASKTYLRKSSASQYLTKKVAENSFITKRGSDLPPVSSIAASTTLFSLNTGTSGYIPTAFTSFATKANVSTAVVTFSGAASCTNPAKAPTPDQACPITILIDGQPAAKKINFAPATAEGTSTKPAAANIHTIVQTTVLGKGGHTVQIEYAGAAGLNFQLKSWNLAVQAYPQAEELEEEPTTTTPPKSPKS